jgi:PGF-pre-PGF domain-containing protein
MGGYYNGGMNDVWQSKDAGTTWTRLTAGAGWSARRGHTSVVLPDGSIVITGGDSLGAEKNDVWRFETATPAKSPVRTFSEAGNYSVTLQVYNNNGYTRETKPGYISVYNRPPENITVRVGGSSAVSQVDVTGTGIRNLIVTGTQITKPNLIAAPPGMVYRFIDIIPARYTTITGATIYFSVPQFWFEDNGISPENVVLYRRDETGWVALHSTIVKTTEGSEYFSAKSNGFSTFAIAGTPGSTTAATVENQ